MLNCSTLAKRSRCLCASAIFSAFVVWIRATAMIIVCAFGGTLYKLDRAWWHTLLFTTVASCVLFTIQLNDAVTAATTVTVFVIVIVIVTTSSSSATAAAQLYYFNVSAHVGRD